MYKPFTRAAALSLLWLASGVAVAAPTAVSDTFVANEDDVLNIAARGVLDNDTGDASLVVDRVERVPGSVPGDEGTTPNGTLFTVFADGSMRYSANGKYESLAAGESAVDDAGGFTTQYRAKDGTAGPSAFADITVTINGVNDDPTDITLTNATIAETTNSNAMIGNMTTTDVDTNNTHTYSLVSGTGSTDNDSFNFSGATLRATNGLDAEVKTSYSIRVRTTDNDGGTFDKTFIINATDENDNAPVVDASQSFNISEDIANNASVGTPTASDADVTPTTLTNWDEAGGTGVGFFEIDATSGEITVFDSSTFDFDSATTSYTYVVTVQDTGGNNTSAAETITINLTNVNDNNVSPVTDSNATANSVDENAATDIAVGVTASASDADAGATITYSLTDSAGNRFKIDDSTGVVTTTGVGIDREANASHTITVQAASSDSSTATTEDFVITVNDLNDVVPVITGAQSFSIAEDIANNALVGLVVATDSDVTATTFTNWTETGGTGAAIFEINGGSITVADNSSIDFETLPNSYTYTVTVQDTDGKNTSAAETITINLTNVNDNNVSPVTDSNATANSVDENAATDIAVGVTASASDADVGATITYSLTDSAGNRFKIDDSTGVVTTTGVGIDREANASHTITVQAASSDSSTATTAVFSIVVVDLNDTAPVVTASQVLAVPENSGNGTVVGTVAATDADTEGTLQDYAIVSGNTNSAFIINDANGEIRVNDVNEMDRETTPSYTLGITVSDGLRGSAIQDVTVNVTDVVDTFPKAQNGPESIRANVGQTFAANSATPADDLWNNFVTNPDGGVFANTDTCRANCTYAAVHVSGDTIVTPNTDASAGLPNGFFHPLDIDGVSPYSTAGKEVFEVKATRISDGAESDALTVTVIVNGAPVISSNGGDATAALNLAENNTAVTTVTATDVNLPDDSLTFSITGGADSGRFSVVPGTGVLTFNSAPDFETPLDVGANNTYEVTVRVTDQGADTAAGLFDEQTITVTITDANDIAPVLDDPGTINVNENVTGTIVTLTANNDVDSAGFTFSLLAGGDAGLFNVDVNSGALSFVASPDFEAPADTGADNTYNLTARVDDGVATDDQALIVVVAPLNDNTPAAVADAYAVNEGAAVSGTDGFGGTGVLSNDSDADLPGDVITVNLVADVANGNLTLNNDGSFTYTHDDSETLTDSFTYNVGDGANISATVAVTITVNPINDNTPIADAESFTVVEAGTASQANLDAGSTLLDGDTDVDTANGNDTLTVSAVNGSGANVGNVAATTNGTVTVQANGNFSYTHDGSETISDSFTYTVSDLSGKNDTETVTITITPVNDNVPVADAETFTLNEGATATQADLDAGSSLLDGDTDADTANGNDALSVSEVNGSAANVASALALTNGTVTVQANGNFSYTHDGSETLSDSFTYTVTDQAGQTDSATVTITVTPVNDNTPVADAESFTLNEGATATQANLDAGTSLLDGDTDVDTANGSDSLTVSEVNGSAANVGSAAATTNGTVTVQANGDFTYTHDGSETTSDSFTYTVSDQAGQTDTETVTITVTLLNENSPVFTNADTASTSENTTPVLTVTTTDVDTVSSDRTYTLTGGADQGKFTVDLNSGVLTFNAAPDFDAPGDANTDNDYLVEVTANDGENFTSQLITVTVTDVNDNAPVFTNATTANVNENDTAVLTLTTTDVDTVGSAHQYTVTGAADQGDFLVNISGGQLTFSPAPDFENPADADTNNIYEVQVTADDGANQTNQTITVTVQNLSDTPPTGADKAVTILEDGTYNFQISDFGFSDPDGDSFASITLNTLPTLGDLKLSGVPITLAGTTVAAANLATLTYDPDNDGDGIPYANFNFTVRDNTGVNATSANTFTVNVTAVADTPSISSFAARSVDEDNPTSLGLNASLNDADNETLTVVITGLPAGANLSDGTNSSSSASTDVSSWTLNDIEVTSALHDDADFTLTMTATATEAANGDTAQDVTTTNVTVNAKADQPNLTVTATTSGGEDTAIPLTINGSLVDTDGSETLTYRISNVPTGATLSAGVNAGAGVWNLVAGDVSELTVTPPSNSATDFSIDVRATATEGDGGDTANSGTESIAVTVIAVADTPNLSANAAITTNEDTQSSTLNVVSSLNDSTDETLTVEVLGVPVGATLTDGVNTQVSGGTAIDVTSWIQSNINVKPALHDDSDFTLTIRATATEAENGDTATTSVTSDITVTAVVDTPSFNVTGTASGSEDVPIALDITGSLVDADGSETLTFQVTGVPIGATLNKGTNAGAGVWNLAETDISGLTLTSNLHDDADFTISVTATAVDNDASSITLAAKTISVTVAAVADVPTVTVTGSVTRNEDNNPFPLTIAGDLVDTDGSETLSYEIIGVIATATLSAGTDQGGGRWTLTEAQAESGLTLTMDDHVADEFQITVRTLATEARDGTSAFSAPGTGRINIFVTDVADEPTVAVTPTTSGNEDTAIPLTITGGLLDQDGSETLTMVITGQPAGSTFSAGTDLGSGAWGVDGGDLSGLTISAAEHNNDDFTLTVTSTAEEQNGGDTSVKVETISVTILAVNDAPTVDDQTFAIDENTSAPNVVGTVIATDIEPVGSEPAQTLNYAIDGTAFAIDNAGVITVADSAQIDFETTPTFTLEVTVSDNGLPSESDTGTITINLNPLEDNDPTAVDDAVDVDELDTISFNVLDNDIDLDQPANTLTVVQVDGDVGLVGVPIDKVVDGDTVGTLTINSDGSATFVTTADNTVEKFLTTASYVIFDGTTNSDPGTLTITINPLNDNQPELSASGTALESSGVTYDEDDHLNVGTGFTVILNPLFIDLDIDEDGILDSGTTGDNDSLVFAIVSNSDSSVVQTDLQDGDLTLFSASNIHGSATIVISATDTADPAGNISTETLTFEVTVNSVNDAPINQIGFYSNFDIDEDSGDISLNLLDGFSDADLTDADGSDDSLTYRLTIIDDANDFVLTNIIDKSGLTVISDDEPEGGVRTLVVETTNPTITLPVKADAHGILDITIRATDRGIPPVSTPVPLFDEDTIRVTINALGDDQPAAEDDHYNDNPGDLVIPEDSDPITFDVTSNDDHGDVPIKVISVGQTITDSAGTAHTWRTTSRLADPNDTGDFQIEINGEVSCAYIDCVDGETPDTIITGDGISDNEIIYRPRADFNGEDSFTYCIEDSAPANEDPFTPPNDPRCATVTINVTPVNDIPVVEEFIVIVMEQADALQVTAEDGLRNFVRDVDNTHIDGLGCDPRDVTCDPLDTEPQPDQLYFNFASATTEHGQLSDFLNRDGAFTYRPDATFSGDDQFSFEVCDSDTSGDPDSCTIGLVSIQIQPLEGAPEGSSDEAVQFDYQLAQTPLELPIGPEPNVLIVNDDSGSMGWDIMSEGTSGLYQVSTGHSIYYVNVATASGSNLIAPAEDAAPNQGFWRLRSPAYNTVYYNPAIRYKPWEGLDTSDVEFPDSPATAARHNPLLTTPTTNLTTAINFTGAGVVTTPRECTTRCRRRNDDGECISTRTTCTGGDQFTTIDSTNFYIPRYYTWIDRDGDGNLDATPSPALDPSNSEGVLVEILNDGTQYPRGADRTDCTTNGTFCTYTEEIANFANWFTYYRSREFTAKAALGIVVANAENLRVGYAKLNSETNILPVKSMNTSERTGEKAALLDAIYVTNSSGGTPLRRSLQHAGRYFECRANDIFNSANNTLPGNADCPILPAPDGNCQQSFTLLITDGTWNGSSPQTGNSDGDNNTNFDGGAFAGANFTTLSDVAMLYYERDLHSTLNNEVPTTGRDRDLASATAFENGGDELMHQHMTTYTVGFGVSGLVTANPTNYAVGFNWGNPFSSSLRKTDDVRHAAYNGRGEYLDASDASQLAKKLVEAFDEFSQGSGAASAVSFNSQEIQQDTLIFRAFYNTKINTGDLIAQSLTEDGLAEEPVWRSAEVMDSKAATDREIITWDPDGAQGIPFRPSTLTLDQENVFTSAPLTEPAQRNTEITQRVNYLRGDDANERPVGNFRERPTIEGRLGDIVHSTPVFVGAPNRVGRDQSPFPQSDLYSSFRASNADRTEVIYVSANDGFLHGFKAEDGSEVFAYMPNNLMLGTFSRRVTELLDFEYAHKFFVDLTPALNDVYMDADDDGSKEWITMLVGGHGAGAKAYFALNVTDPTKLSEATASDVVLWEFTDADDTYPTDSAGNALRNGSGGQRQDLQDTPQPVKDLGYSFSVPTMAMSNAKDSGGNQRWVAVFGNGFNSTSGIAKLFVLFIDGGIDGDWCHPDQRHTPVLDGAEVDCGPGGPDFVKIDTRFGASTDGFPNGLGTPRGIDTDGNGTIDYAYAGDTFGNLFRFDLTSLDYEDWTFTKIFEAKYTDPVTSTVTQQPITTQPIVTAHPTEQDGFIVIFATGSYITVPDGANKDVQSIYGIWDRLAPELITTDEMVQQRYTNLFNSEFGNVRALSNNEVDYSADGGRKGWYNHLDSVAVGGNQTSDPPEFPGEKAVRNIQLRGGLAFVNSIIPRSDTSCVDVAGGFALSFCPGTGGTNCLANRGIFDLDNDGAFDDGDEVDGQVVAGTRFEDAVPTDSSFIEDKRITQLSDKSLDSTKTNTSGGTNTGRLSWKQLDSVN